MFSLFSVRGLHSKNQYSSSISTIFALCIDRSLLFLRQMAFFYPICHIGFVHLKNFSNTSSTDSAVVHFDCQLSGFFRIFMLFRVYRVIYAALLTFAALASRRIVPCLNLVLCLSAFWASFPCLFFLFSHIFYYIIKSLFRTLPKV